MYDIHPFLTTFVTLTNMREKMEHIKTFIVTFLSGLAAYLDPIAGNIFSLFWVFFINFLVGYLSGKVKGEDFDFKKAFRCIKEATIFFVAVASIFVIGRLNGNKDGALQCVATVVNVIFYYYGCNVTRNLKTLLKEDTTAYRVVDCIYYLISIEWAKNLPFINNYIAKQNEKN